MRWLCCFYTKGMSASAARVGTSERDNEGKPRFSFLSLDLASSLPAFSLSQLFRNRQCVECVEDKSVTSVYGRVKEKASRNNEKGV